MSKIILFIGDTDQSVATVAAQHCDSAFLIHKDNYQILFEDQSQDITVYTSLGDLPKELSLVYQILNQADEIFYCAKDTIWSDNRPVNLDYVTDSIQGLTEFVLFEIGNLTNKVKNLNLEKYLPVQHTVLLDCRKSVESQLWISGGSDVEGVGVDQSQRFGQLLADRLSMSVSFLAKAGSAIEYQADQILRSNIQQNDIVVWGIPMDHRIPFWSEKSNKTVHLTSLHRSTVGDLVDISPKIIDRLLADKNCFHQSLIHIYQVVNFCNQLNAKLLIVGLSISDTLAIHLHNIPQFINFKNKDFTHQFLDLGNDELHPGPTQHQAYADFCQAQLKKLNYIQ